MSTDGAPQHPDGTIKVYRDALDRPQISVDGPKGHVLVTHRHKQAGDRVFEVWRSNSLRTLARTTDRTRALKIACQAAGLDPRALVLSGPRS